MKKSIWALPLLLVILTQFNNCSPYAQSDNSSLSSIGDLSCANSACVTPTVANLAVSPNLYAGASFAVNSGLGDFNIGGDCNEGGFAYNTITWALLDSNNIKVRDSGMAGANSACVNGRFSIYVKLSQIPGDNVDRTGLMTNGVPSTRQQYTLQIQIFGQIVQNGAYQMGTDATRSVILTGI